MPFASLSRLSYTNALFIIGSLGTLITPALLEAWTPLGWGTSRLGAVAGIELAGLAVGAFSGLWWQRRWRWRPIALVSLLLGIIANVLCAHVHDFYAVCALRLVVGLAGGLLTAIYSAVIANTAAPGRVIAVTTFVQIGIEAAVLYFSAPLFENLREGALFYGMAGFFAALLPALRLLPAAWPRSEATESTTAEIAAPSWTAYLILAAFVPFIVVQTGVYTFLAEFGHRAAHLDDHAVFQAIGMSVLLSALGSVAAFVLPERVRLWLPVSAGLALMASAATGMILGSTSPLAFLIYISLLQIGWVFFNCYLYTALIASNNLLVPAATPVSAIGSVLGASLMGVVLEQGGLRASLALCVGCLAATGLLTLPVLARRRRAETQEHASLRETAAIDL